MCFAYSGQNEKILKIVDPQSVSSEFSNWRFNIARQKEASTLYFFQVHTTDTSKNSKNNSSMIVMLRGRYPAFKKREDESIFSMLRVITIFV